jgi:hypothetical protein
METHLAITNDGCRLSGHQVASWQHGNAMLLLGLAARGLKYKVQGLLCGVFMS